MSARVKEALRLADHLERVWSDDRFDDGRQHGLELREFITAWYVNRYRIDDHDAAFYETLNRQHLDGYGWRRLLRADAPRFDGMEYAHDYHRCPTLKTRGPNAGRPCGRSTQRAFRVTEPATGEWTIQGWCRDHQRDADLMWARERSLTNVPEPMPNVGGLLPSHIRATNWPDLYRSVDSRWTPPYVGIIADDWPTLAKAIDPPTTKVTFTSLDGGGEKSDDATPTVPALRLVTTS